MKKIILLVLLTNLCILYGCVQNNNSNDNLSTTDQDIVEEEINNSDDDTSLEDIPSPDNQNSTDESNNEIDNDNKQENIDSTFVMCEIKTNDLDVFKYYLYTPQNPSENMPLIVYLHGGSGKGDDLSLITNIEGFPKYLRDGQLGDINAYVIIPQVPSIKRGWPEIRNSLNYLIDNIVTQYKINNSKVSLTGHSMGERVHGILL